jgi:hypothetical protein
VVWRFRGGIGIGIGLGLAAMAGVLACRGTGASAGADAGADASAGAGAGARAGAGASAGAGAGEGAGAGARAGRDAGGGAGFVSAAAVLEAAGSDAGPMRGPGGASHAGDARDLPAGTFASGSTPGDEGRDPTVEPALVDVSLGAYAIDALPYPNDPALPFKTGAGLEEATRLCRDRGARLCTELEWERACKGPDGDAFATGARWNVACEKDRAACASGFGARAMGTLAELTDSRFAGIGGNDGALVVRGGAHRCAARAKVGDGVAGAKVSDLAFRCCKGAPNVAKIAPIEPRPAFKKTTLEPVELARIFAKVPELARLGSDLRYFTEGDVRALTARSSTAHEGITFMTTPIVWSPETGAELLVATGRGKTMSFVVALWTLPGDRYRFASAFLMLNDLSPVALAFDPARGKELHWTSCWGCSGEQGFVSYRPEEHRVVIVQQ